MTSATQSMDFRGSIPQSRGAGRQHFHQRKAQSGLLNPESFSNGFFGLNDMSIIVKRNTLDINCAGQGGHHFADIDRMALCIRITTKGRGGRYLPDQGGGRHLAGCHAVNGVVGKKHADFFPAGCGVNDFGRADGRQIAVALIGEDDLVEGWTRLMPVAAAGARP